MNGLTYNQGVVKAVMPEESLPRSIEGEVISVYTVKLIFDEMKKSILLKSGIGLVKLQFLRVLLRKSKR